MHVLKYKSKDGNHVNSITYSEKTGNAIYKSDDGMAVRNIELTRWARIVKDHILDGTMAEYSVEEE
jgi:hypothetical protein